MQKQKQNLKATKNICYTLDIKWSDLNIKINKMLNNACHRILLRVYHLIFDGGGGELDVFFFLLLGFFKSPLSKDRCSSCVRTLKYIFFILTLCRDCLNHGVLHYFF